jgi:Mn2+/Fe2+ NRAMP family transporter
MAKADMGRISREAARIMGPAFLVSVSAAAAGTAAAAAIA